MVYTHLVVLHKDSVTLYLKPKPWSLCMEGAVIRVLYKLHHEMDVLRVQLLRLHSSPGECLSV